MHIGTHPGVAPSGAGPPPRQVRLCLVVADVRGLSDPGITHEILALRALGHAVLPVLLSRAAPAGQDTAASDDEPPDPALIEAASSLDDVSTLAALAATANPAGLVASVRFLQRRPGRARRTLLRAAVRLAHFARARGCTHLHAHFAGSAAATTAICAARIAGLTASVTVRDSDLAPAAGGFTSDLMQNLAAADLVIAGNGGSAGAVRRLAPYANIRTIPPGVAPHQFHPLPDPSNRRLLSVGGPAASGHDTLLAALAALPPPRRPSLDIVGGGSLHAELRAQVEERGLQTSVNLLGPRPTDWIAAEGPRYQGFVAAGPISGDSDLDADALAVKRAMAMGLPVIGSAIPELREIVDESCGRLVAPGDGSELGEALVWLAGLPPAARERLGAAGRARVQEHFALRRQAERLAAAIAELRR